MSDWFSFWGGQQQSDTNGMGNTLGSMQQIQKANAGLDLGKNIIGAAEGVTNYFINRRLYAKERDSAIRAIENNLLAGQEQIFRELSYNTDQAITYAARGNVSIGAPVLRERMKKGSEQAGYDFGLLQTNANIEKIKVNAQYSAKRRASFTKALSGVMDAVMSYGKFSSMMDGGADMGGSIS